MSVTITLIATVIIGTVWTVVYQIFVSVSNVSHAWARYPQNIIVTSKLRHTANSVERTAIFYQNLKNFWSALIEAMIEKNEKR